MTGIKELIYWINTTLEKQLLSQGIKFAYNGLTVPVTSGNQTFPVHYRGLNGSFSGFDDKADVSVYHKMTAVRAVFGRSYGDREVLTNRYSVQMVFFGDSGRVKMTPDELFLFVQMSLPSSLSSNDRFLSSAGIEITGANFNSSQVFGQEYRGIDYPLNGEQFLMVIDYTVEASFNKDCFNCC